jgi:hypothetical protein
MCHWLEFQKCKLLQTDRFKTQPKAEVRGCHLGASRRKAGKTALFVDLRAESWPSEPFRGSLPAAAATHFDLGGEKEKSIFYHSI